MPALEISGSTALALLPILIIALLPILRRLQTQLSTLRSPKQSHEIVALRIYPIKSCRGITLPRTKLLEQGLALDRRWMIVDAETHSFLTIRQNPRMTLITTALTSTNPNDSNSNADPQELNLQITLPPPETENDTNTNTSPKPTTLIIPAHPTATYLSTHTTLAHDIKIWDTTTDGHIYNEEINAAISAFMGRPVALVYKGPTPRILKGNGDPRLLGREQSTNFPDVHPVQIASEASLAELNTRLVAQGEKAITIERFRPNIIVKGVVPWEEDRWKTVRIVASGGSEGSDGKGKGKPGKNGKDLVLDIVARCARCHVPNVEPATAEEHRKQPWDTLMAYRRVDEGMKYKPCFGMLSAPRAEGEIAVGMRLEVLQETTAHRYIAGF
ncbi:MOSC domain-containing protein [Aspergillus homomorphus CBS 101889]|uniref:MOSC-domain-containing protein n=1 Tax=Aspergillus homomorphus (strain CBS 101889) TaxID=1450537 RepID=A0A395ICF1_ASPHC|nr:MOSC-domain-containing protein [Aspergillus homomorphus CBS 101889]RAL17675.1 MOSC-domain-containing protein [Aspergillus homomorphus CBS 101889]